MLVVAAGCTGSNGGTLSHAPSGILETRGRGFDGTLAADMQRTLERARIDQRFPGVSAAVVLPDGSLWAGASGDADVDTRRPVTPHTIFALASMSKAFVSVLTT